MNYKKACGTLELNMEDEITTESLKRQYRRQALKYHPDKNPSNNAVAKFQEIQESYEFLKKYKDFKDFKDSASDSEEDTDSENSDCSENRNNYKHILLSFLKNILIPEKRNQLFYTILKQVASTCEANALEILRKLEKQNLIQVFDIIDRNKDVLHFTEEFINQIKDLISEKTKNDECIILNPTLIDLFENNLYKVKINGFTYVVPLWHNELVYDNSGNDIYVKCVPILPENTSIDDKNNIHVSHQYKIQDIWKKECLTITVGSANFYILRETLKMKEEQSFTFIKQGISRINTKNIYDVENKGDVIITIQLDM